MWGGKGRPGTQPTGKGEADVREMRKGPELMSWYVEVRFSSRFIGLFIYLLPDELRYWSGQC